MKSFPTKAQHIVITAILIGFVFLSALGFPGQTEARQSTPEPVPTSTPIVGYGTIRESGDTEGLIWGAGIILVIILGGVIIQRVIIKPDSNRPE
jgi:hypothetical protein